MGRFQFTDRSISVLFPLIAKQAREALSENSAFPVVAEATRIFLHCATRLSSSSLGHARRGGCSWQHIVMQLEKETNQAGVRHLHYTHFFLMFMTEKPGLLRSRFLYKKGNGGFV
jgi:hypothetical protein